MPRWEYRVINEGEFVHMLEAEEWGWEDDNHSTLGISVLNKFGDEGWEFCGADEEFEACFFKRKRGSTQKWEYGDFREMLEAEYERAGHFTEKDCMTAKSLLNKAGANGWELCEINAAEWLSFSFVMKRPKKTMLEKRR